MSRWLLLACVALALIAFGAPGASAGDDLYGISGPPSLGDAPHRAGGRDRSRCPGPAATHRRRPGRAAAGK